MTVPTFRELTPEECEALLAVNHVGRLAFSFKDRTDIEPIHYVFDNGWIFGRTAEGSKLDTIGHHPYVAFEVDEVHAIFDWRSVVAHGTVYLLSPGAGGGGRRRVRAGARPAPAVRAAYAEGGRPGALPDGDVRHPRGRIDGREARQGKRRRRATGKRPPSSGAGGWQGAPPASRRHPECPGGHYRLRAGPLILQRTRERRRPRRVSRPTSAFPTLMPKSKPSAATAAPASDPPNSALAVADAICRLGGRMLPPA